MPAGDDDAFISLAHVLRPAAPSEDVTGDDLALPIAVAPPPAGFVDVARDVRVFRAQLADAFDAARDATLSKAARAGLARDIDAVLAALLERLA